MSGDKLLMNVNGKINLPADFSKQKFSPSQMIVFYKLLEKIDPKFEGLMRLPSSREVVEKVVAGNNFDVVSIPEILARRSASYALTNEFRVLLDKDGKIPDAAFDLNASNQFLLLKDNIDAKLEENKQLLKPGTLLVITSNSLLASSNDSVVVIADSVKVAYEAKIASNCVEGYGAVDKETLMVVNKGAANTDSGIGNFSVSFSLDVPVSQIARGVMLANKTEIHDVHNLVSYIANSFVGELWPQLHFLAMADTAYYMQSFSNEKYLSRLNAMTGLMLAQSAANPQGCNYVTQ
ncbi:MAG: hypothetical protein WCY41_04770 [Candidatus Micrarchaeia archaeon]